MKTGIYRVLIRRGEYGVGILHRIRWYRAHTDWCFGLGGVKRPGFYIKKPGAIYQSLVGRGEYRVGWMYWTFTPGTNGAV